MCKAESRIRHGFLAAAVLVSMSGCHRATSEGGKPGKPVGPESWAHLPLYTFTEEQLDAYLPTVRQTEPDLSRRVVALGRQNIGQPYEIYLLGEFPFEFHDPDPIYCLDRSDCVTFCEHTYSMALSSDWWTFLRTLQRLRYRDGRIGMLTRNHYTLADWDRNNAFLFDDLTASLGGGKAAVPLSQVCRRARFFSRFGLGQDIPDQAINDLYVSKERLPSVLSELRDGDFVNIVRGDANSQWVGHTGLIAIAPDGTVNFLHSARPAVREQPLVDYVNSNRRCLGVRILRLKPDAEEIMRRTLASSPLATEVSRSSVGKALARWREAAPPTARPQDLDWQRAMRLQGYRLGYDAPVDTQLQARLVEIDRDLGRQFEIPEAARAVGVLDLTDLRLALVRPDSMFYAASVPKICILLAYFAANPHAATDLPPDVERELGSMIKVSDNALAAKYGRMLGMDQVQEVLQSMRYRLYDQDHGGGLWYGKHYGKGAPRVGDPIHDHSHGATVRQCLRFYLMLEQGRLVSTAACGKMKEIFAAPHLDHRDSKFVTGLQGRDLSLVRKSGTWQDWHLDSARIEHGDRVYLLVGMTHHPRGAEYLAAVAAAVDEELCGPPAPKPIEHQLITHRGAATFEAGTVRQGRVIEEPAGVLLNCSEPDPDAGGAAAEYESQVIETDRLFSEVVLSWNVEVPPHAGFSVEARMGRTADDSWTPYLYFGDWGRVLPKGERTIECPEGAIDVDYFVSSQRFDRVQYRLRAVAEAPATVRIDRVDVCLSDTTARITSVPRSASLGQADAARWQRRLPVPFRSQRTERKELAGRICSPTSVTMMLDFHGVDRPTGEVAARIFDTHYDIYGNWPRAVQAAYSYGVPGYLTRFSSWEDVERAIAADQPLIISIQAAKGELAGAPYKATEGHLLVLTGFDAEGNVEVNDPASPQPEKGQVAYARRDLETVWMKTKGGTAYVLLPPNKPGDIVPPADPSSEALVDVGAVDPRIVIDLKYATPDNFTGQRLYAVARCLLRKSVALRLRRVQDRLVRQGVGLKIYDGYRPLSVQRRMWELVPDPKYVADPAKGSRHNRGAAVDVTLVDAEGRELEMPTAYDDFTPAAHRDYTGGSTESLHHRQMLTDAMVAAGFKGLDSEWWHFDAPGWEAYPVLDKDLEDIAP